MKRPTMISDHLTPFIALYSEPMVQPPLPGTDSPSAPVALTDDLIGIGLHVSTRGTKVNQETTDDD